MHSNRVDVHGDVTDAASAPSALPLLGTNVLGSDSPTSHTKFGLSSWICVSMKSYRALLGQFSIGAFYTDIPVAMYHVSLRKAHSHSWK